MWILFQAQAAQATVVDLLPSALNEPNEFGIWATILSIATWAIRTWWKSRTDLKHRTRVEKRLEEDWSNGDSTLTGSKNPGRTTSQLVEIVHEDLQAHKKETNARFDKVHSDLGKIKGKLGVE
jgi:hypothetical protein